MRLPSQVGQATNGMFRAKRWRAKKIGGSATGDCPGIFRAELKGPKGAPAWVRAWLSNDAGTLAETASPQLRTGDEVRLEVTLRSAESPLYAYMRIESAPLKTEHVVVLKLT